MNLTVTHIWPNLTRLVGEMPRRVMSQPRVLKAFKEYGEFTDKEVKEVLGPGTLPEIRVERLPPKTWGTTPDAGDHCALNMIMIDQFELLFMIKDGYHEGLTHPSERAQRRREWQMLVERAELTIEALILHELVHWGDGQVHRHHTDPNKHLHQDNAAKRAGFGDRGHQFVHAAYGKRFRWERDKKTGRLFTDHDVVGWIGAFKQGDDWYIYNPLGKGGPAPIRPPSLKSY